MPPLHFGMQIAVTLNLFTNKRLMNSIVETNGLLESLKLLVSFWVETLASTCFSQEMPVPHQHIL